MSVVGNHGFSSPAKIYPSQQHFILSSKIVINLYLPRGQFTSAPGPCYSTLGFAFAAKPAGCLGPPSPSYASPPPQDVVNAIPLVLAHTVYRPGLCKPGYQLRFSLAVGLGLRVCKLYILPCSSHLYAVVLILICRYGLSEDCLVLGTHP